MTAPVNGLRPFDVDESRIFFGRQRQVDEIIGLLEQHHFAAVMGGSGSGKSSLIRAGVIPKLRAYGISEEGDFWVPVAFTPQHAPVTRLAKQLDKTLEYEPDEEAAGRRLRRIEHDEELLKLANESEPSARDILRHPIARIPIKGQRVTGLLFTKSGEPGGLQIQFASGSRIDVTWGREALLKRTCAILAQIDDEARKDVINSAQHTPFFTQIAKAEGDIIARNNRYECVCGEADCRRKESD